MSEWVGGYMLVNKCTACGNIMGPNYYTPNFSWDGERCCGKCGCTNIKRVSARIRGNKTESKCGWFPFSVTTSETMVWEEKPADSPDLKAGDTAVSHNLMLEILARLDAIEKTAKVRKQRRSK